MDSNDVRRQWAERSGEYSPEYYAHYGPDETSEEIRRILDRSIDRSAPVLELGCSSGRHLSHLHESGFDNLAGIEVNDDAFKVMEDSYPDLADAGEFYHDAIENVVDQFDTDRFRAVYSVETLQHLHPDVEWVYGEIARITDELLVTVENEGDRSDEDVNYVNDEFPLYYRDWNTVFTERGFVEVDANADRRDTVRTFRTEPT